MMIEEWRAALVEVPSDVLAFARTLNVEVAMNQGQAPRGRAARMTRISCRF